MAASRRAQRPQKAGASGRARATAPVFLSSEFWAEFAAEIWEKRPALYRQPFAPPLVAPAELFRATLRASRLYRDEAEDVPLSFYIEHARVVASVADYLPTAADKNMERYARRISRMLDGRRFALIIEDIQAYSPSLWRRFTSFLGPLDEAIPEVGARRKATVFIGDYAMTPSGLHVGTSGNFKFVVSGRKRMRLWPDAFFRGRKGVNHTTHVEPFLRKATTLEAAPGDIIYWPSDQWHVGEALGGLAVSISLAIFVQTRASEPQRGDERAIAAWLNQQTSGGFAHVPGPVPRGLKMSAHLRGVAPRPILWRHGRNGEIICSANGHAFAIQENERAIALLERLNTGERLVVPRDRSLRALLEKLHQLRAVAEC